MPKPATSLKTFKAKSVMTVRQQQDARHKMAIRVSKISKKIADFAEASPDDEDYDRKAMSLPQLKAAEMLLNRTVPVLSAVQIVGDDANENLSREEIEARIKEKIENNPMLGVLAGLVPDTIDGKVIDDPKNTDRDE